MKYQEAVEKLHMHNFLYEGVTQQEVDEVSISKYVIEDDEREGYYVIGTLDEVVELKAKTMVQTIGRTFG